MILAFGLATLGATGAAAAGSSLANGAVEVKTQYVCANGRAVEVLFRNPTHLAIIENEGKQIILYQSPVADGFRYIGGDLEIRGKGDVLTFKRAPDTEIPCVVKPATITPGTLTGTTGYRTRNALPKGTVVTVELRDVSRADAPAPIVASTKMVTTGNQVPLSWLIKYDPRKIDPAMTYAVTARFTDAAGKLVYTNDTQVPVLTRGAPADDVDLPVVPVAN
jgi:putative lipoprotein